MLLSWEGFDESRAYEDIRCIMSISWTTDNKNLIAHTKFHLSG